MECLYEALKRAGDRIRGSFPLVVPLALHSSISYLGFFVSDSPADVIREFATTFAMEVAVLAGRLHTKGAVDGDGLLCVRGRALLLRRRGPAAGGAGCGLRAAPCCRRLGWAQGTQAPWPRTFPSPPLPFQPAPPTWPCSGAEQLSRS